MNVAPLPLVEWTGAQWELEAPVVALAWDAGSEAFGFALGDGTLALADTICSDRAGIQAQDDGRVGALTQPSSAPPLRRLHVHDGMCLSLAADVDGGFLSGGDDGRLVRTSPEGVACVLAHEPGHWIDHVAASQAGRRAFATGRRICVPERQGASIELPASATALAFDSDGLQLAIAHYGGATVWSFEGKPRGLVWPGYHRAVAWSPDGRYLFTGMQENALHGWRLEDDGDIEIGGYPGQPLFLSFLAGGRLLATSGANRVTCWRVDAPGSASHPLQCGIESKTPLTTVSAHPTTNLIAAGYYNGAVLLTQPGTDDVLFVRNPGDGPVTALAWSSEGNRLAFGTERGRVGWVSFPESLFRFKAGTTMTGTIPPTARARS